MPAQAASAAQVAKRNHDIRERLPVVRMLAYVHDRTSRRTYRHLSCSHVWIGEVVEVALASISLRMRLRTWSVFLRFSSGSKSCSQYHSCKSASLCLLRASKPRMKARARGWSSLCASAIWKSIWH